MSIRQIDAAFRRELPHVDTLVLLALAWYADDDGGRVFPSIATLVTRTRLCERSVRATLARLRAAGVLAAVTPSRANRPTEYRILPDPCTPCTPAPDAPLHAVHLTPASPAPLPLHAVPVTPAPHAPNPSGIRQKDPSGNGHRARTRAERASRLPEDFALTEPRQRFAEAGGLHAPLEFAAFKDHHRAKGTRFVDWDAGWQTWCRRAHDFHRPPHPPGGHR